MAGRKLKKNLDEIKDAEPGSRFEEAHERHRIDNHVVRVGVIVLGALIVVAGAATFWLPGPQVLIVIVGLALMASQWRVVARLLDRIEVAGRTWHEERWEPYPHKGRVKVLGTLVFIAVVAALGWLAWDRGWLPSWLPLID